MFESDEEDCQSTFPEESSKPSDQTIQARTYSINIRIGIAKNHDQGEGEALHPSPAYGGPRSHSALMSLLLIIRGTICSRS